MSSTKTKSILLSVFFCSTLIVMIPYFIIIAQPDHKRPYTRIVTGVCDNESEILMKLREKVVDVLLEKGETLTEYYDSIYSEYYMQQDPIIVRYFHSETWWRYNPFEDQVQINRMYNEQV